MPAIRSYSRSTAHVAALLGKRIKLGRKTRKMTEAQLGERCGISRSTVRAIEAGSLKVEIGLVFEAAYIVGVRLFVDDDTDLTANIQPVDDRLALLPKRVRTRDAQPRDDF